MTPRWKQFPPGSHWGEFGPDDRLGRMNLVTPTKVRQGMAEVREGLTFCLSLPLDVPGGMALNARRLPPGCMARCAMARVLASRAFAGLTQQKTPI